jgi:hypothetical protein
VRTNRRALLFGIGLFGIGLFGICSTSLSIAVLCWRRKGFLVIGRAGRLWRSVQLH